MGRLVVLLHVVGATELRSATCFGTLESCKVVMNPSKAHVALQICSTRIASEGLAAEVAACVVILE